jgi:Uma2 family endonuclease
MTSLTLTLKPMIQLTEQQFSQLCQANPDAKLELTAQGELVIMSPTGGTTGNRNIKLSTRLEIWTESDRNGIAFDSSTMFRLPDGALRSPDAAWISLERWNQLTTEEQDEFPPICPDFVVEIRSSSDRLISLQKKMQEYMDNGTRLGWLIDPKKQTVEIYRRGREKEILANPTQLSGEDVLPEFVLNLSGIL